MQRRLFFIFILSLVLLSACRKDTLHWQVAQRLESHTTNRLNKILFVNDTLGFVIGGARFDYSDLLTTTDGGHTFQARTFPEAPKGLYSITQAPNGDLYTIAFDGKLLHSTDLGANWHFRQIDYQPFKSIVVNRAGNLLISGGISFEIGFMYRYNAIGDLLGFDTSNYEVNDVVLLPDRTGYMCGYGVMARTTDDGATWQFQDIREDNFNALDVHSTNEVWTCGWNGSIYHTIDGGRSWVRKRNGNDLTKPRYHLYDILFTDAQNGYAVGENGLVIYSDDGGDHWMEMDRFTGDALYSVALCPDKSLLICGENGVLYRLQKK